MTDTKAPIRQRRALSPAQAFEEAVARHRAGRLDEAEKLYRAVLKLSPYHFGATHYLALACTQQGKLDQAEALLQKAVALDAESAEARTNLGIALAALQRPEEAIVQYEKALALAPNYVDAHNNLGIALQALKKHEQAAARFEAALALKPDNPFVLNNLGSALTALGRHDEAVAAYRTAIRLDPRFADAHNNLGLALATLDRVDEAVAQYRKAIELKDDYAEAHGNLGAALNKLERREEAIPHFERALELNPRLAEAHNDIGSALAALERYEEAVKRYRRAIGLRPTFAEAHHNIGNALVALERRGEAIRHFQAAVGLKPDAFETRISLAGALSFVDRHDEAIAEFRAALALRPDSAEAHWQLGGGLEAASRPEEAILCHRQALTIRPEFAWAHNALGTSLMTLGRMAEGRQSIEKAIELAPTEAEFYRNLAMSKRFAPGDPQLQTMEELARDLGTLPENQRMALQYALGKAYADLGRQQEALRRLIEANALRRKDTAYDEKATLGQLDRIRQVFTPDLMRRKAGHGASSDVPVFIVGMPRSGSTLIEQILASHPDVFGAGELGNLSETVAHFCTAAPAKKFADVIADTPAEQLREVGAHYLDSVRALAPEARRITDKSLLNYRLAGLIHLALPGARIIHARRNPIDNCLSCFEREFAKTNQPFTYDLAELGRYYRAYDALMTHWRRALPEGAMLEVQYEELVADFEPQARRIVGYCGLDWDERCRAFYKTDRPVRTASVAQVREPLYRSSVGRWHSVTHLLRPLLDELEI